MTLSGSSCVVLGHGRSGLAAARLLASRGARVTIADSSRAVVATEEFNVLRGADAEKDSTRYDLAILSPGIDPAVPLVGNVLRKGIPVIGELELGFREASCPVVAVTGTNGKTTTTSLLEAMLQAAGVESRACGNIGTPLCEVVQATRPGVLVVEVSSFQLESIQSFRPAVAVWLNLNPNHLDRYPDMAAYKQAKLRIFENQKGEDHAVVNALSDLPELVAQRTTFSAFSSNADFTAEGTRIKHRGRLIVDLRETALAGAHNLENAMAALGAGLALGLALEKLVPALHTFRPPPHRCEWIRRTGEVDWINDSKSTNLDSLEKALFSQDRPVVLVAGGKDKGFGFEPLADTVSRRVRAAVLIGEMRHRIASAWPRTACHTADSLEEAVATAAHIAQRGDTVLFSPGTSSFDMFRNYEHRGDTFRNLVQQLHTTP